MLASSCAARSPNDSDVRAVQAAVGHEDVLPTTICPHHQDRPYGFPGPPTGYRALPSHLAPPNIFARHGPKPANRLWLGMNSVVSLPPGFDISCRTPLPNMTIVLAGY